MALGVLTRGLGLGQAPGRLLTRGLGLAVAPPQGVLAGDLLAAVVAAFDASAPLVAATGQVLPWRQKRFIAQAAPKAVLPYVIVGNVDGVALYDSCGDPVAPGEVTLSSYAETRDEAVALAKLVEYHFRDVPLKFDGGNVVSFRCTNPFQGATIDPKRWRDGTRAWGVVRRFRVLMG